MARGRRFLEQDTDFNLSRVYNPRAPVNPIDIVRLEDLSATSSSVSTAEALATVTSPFLRVLTFDDLFFHKPESMRARDGKTILYAPGPPDPGDAPGAPVNLHGDATHPGRWERLLLPSFQWLTQLTWSINESTGNDENTGVDDAHALATWDEWLRRTRGMNLAPLAGPLIVRQIGAVTSLPVLDLRGQIKPTVANYFAIVGIPTVLHSGTLATASATSTTEQQLLTDGGVANWTSAGLVSTSTTARLIRRASGDVRAWLIAEPITGSARIDFATNTQESPATFNTSLVNFAPGDAYEVVSLPTFPPVLYDNDNVVSSLKLQTLELTAGGATVRQLGNIQMTLCSVRGAFSSQNSLIGTNLVKCIMLGGGTWTGTVVPFNCAFLGNGSSTVVQLQRFFSDWNGLNNVFQGCGLAPIHHAALDHTGTLRFYGYSGTQILVDLDSTMLLDNDGGNGCTGAMVVVNRNGSWVAGNKANFTVNTSLPFPFQITGVGVFRLSDLPRMSAGPNGPSLTIS